MKRGKVKNRTLLNLNGKMAKDLKEGALFWHVCSLANHQDQTSSKKLGYFIYLREGPANLLF